MRLLITSLAACALLISCSSKQKQADATATTKTATTATADNAKTAKAKKTKKGAATTTEAGTKITCTKGKEERTLEVAADGNGCKLNYTKAGATTNPATSVHGTSYCQKVSDKIQKNLTSSGYECK